MSQSIIAIISSVVATLIFTFCLPLKKSNYLLLILIILPVIALIFFNPKWVVGGWHEFMHASIVYNIINGQIPPEDILLAGYPLKYPWAHHYLVALLCQSSTIAPPIGFAVINIFALIFSSVAIFKIAQLIQPTKDTGIFAVFLAIFGTSIVFLSENLEALFKLNPRTFPFGKFTSANSNPLGFCLFFVCFFFLMRLVSCRGKAFTNAAGIFFSIAGMAFLYPLCWLAMGVTCVAVCSGQAYFMRGRGWQTASIILLATCFGSVLAIPYLHSISAGKAATAEISLNFHIKYRLINLFMISSFPLVILWLQRPLLKSLYAIRSSAMLSLVLGGIGLVLLYLFVSIPDNCEYKFLALIVAVIGIFTAPFFAEFYQEKRILALLIIPLILMPTANRLTRLFAQEQFADPAYTKGIDIIHYDKQMNKLYSWIATETPVNTVVIDSFRSVPALSGRSLYVATDLRQHQEPPSDKRAYYFDGWSMTAKKMSTVIFGQNQEIVKRRLENATALLTPNTQDIVNTAAENVKQEFDQRQVIVIIRDPAIQKAFASNPRFAKRFEESSVSVYGIN